MVSVMNNDFDLERNSASVSDSQEFRVSNDVDNVRDEGVSDSHFNDETRVSSGKDLGSRKSKVDETRVLRGDTGYYANGDSGNSLGNVGVDGDGKSQVRVQEMESIDGEDETVGPEAGVASNYNGVGSRVDDRTRRNVDTGGDDFRVETRGYLQASMSKDVSASDADDEMRGGLVNVMGSKFEMGDMVWGKVKSHPWWPGHLFNEAFATSSVRRTRRHGHMLVAFFGDSSYGWFDLTELVPYDPHYDEKSQQTTSKNFIRAVEESIDEASRRSALGLSCRCRNPKNFRPVNVPGYVAVDVVDYEPGAVYSLSQIKKARESFQPVDTLSFIKQLAVAPMGVESKNLRFIKNKATTFAYRRSVFEEFDETYAQAFNQHPVRASQSPSLAKEPFRAPLSGPLVMADNLGGRKSSTKATKTKDHAKKDRYLFKRRDEAGDLRTSQTTQGHASSALSSEYEDGTSDTVAAAFVFQKRDLPVSNNELGGTPVRDQVETSAHAGSTKDLPSTGLDVMAPSESQALESSTMLVSNLGNVQDKVPEKHINVHTSVDTVHLDTRDGMMKKKKKAPKRPAGEQSSERSDRLVKKVKKPKKVDGQRSTERVEKDSVASVGAVVSAGVPTEIADSSREDFQVIQRRKDDEATDFSSPRAGLMSPGAGGNEAELSRMLADLRGLALNPVHGIERNGPASTRQFFLKFRSLVFLKSSSALSNAESEPGEARTMKTSPAESADKPSIESSKAVKLQKLSARHEDPLKGRKRIPSERQEEIAVKRAKKITEVKSLSADKRALLKNPDMHQRPEGKAKVAAAPSPRSKSMKSEQHQKKVDRPPKVEEPTYLVLKFQSGSSLPSLVELKARFARFGPLNTTLSRVFYKTNTCRVAFLYKQDASVALRYAVGSSSVFPNVKFFLRPVAAPEPQQPSSGRMEDSQSEYTANWDSSASEIRHVGPTPQNPVQQLKSCLKKPAGGDETGAPNNGGGSARTARVRFNMGEVKVSTDDNRGGLQGQKMESRNSMLSSYEGSSPSSSSSVALDVSNNQRFIVSSHPLQPPLLPHPPPLYRPPMNHQFHMVELSPRTNLHDNPRIVPPPPPLENQAPPQQPTTDISQQMMNLLTRCHEVVTNVKSMLGYVPYHPL